LLIIYYYAELRQKRIKISLPTAIQLLSQQYLTVIIPYGVSLSKRTRPIRRQSLATLTAQLAALL